MTEHAHVYRPAEGDGPVMRHVCDQCEAEMNARDSYEEDEDD